MGCTIISFRNQVEMEMENIYVMDIMAQVIVWLAGLVGVEFKLDRLEVALTIFYRGWKQHEMVII